jgi:hypothetical protein
MTNLDFPSNPELGQQYTSPNGKPYWWNGVKWSVKRPVIETAPEPVAEPAPEPVIVEETPVMFASAFAVLVDTGGIDFPPSPIVGFEFTSSSGVNYIFDGVKWVVNQNVVIDNGNTESSYVLPIATNSTLGGVRIGTGIINSNGTISIDTGGSLKGDPGTPGTPGAPGPQGVQGPQGPSAPIATANAAGIVKIGANINVTQDGSISVPTATATTLGVVKPGSNVAIDADGAINVNKGAGINTVKDILDVNTTAGGAALNDGALLVYNSSNQRWDTVQNLRSNEMDGGFF